ncbi:phage major capsid protein [Paraburkholderia sp. J8-2]|uniref:phage major capsid protein n=1 Tax=Paraburkholderia sp. J8-2 TaxID=2805440 RepID=UPI002AB68EAA|nr:phage major capsid protein [Paraburkholderia sp. J8-2]
MHRKTMILTHVAAALLASQSASASVAPRGIFAVRADATNINAAIDGLNRAFASFKETNDKQLAELRAGIASADTQAKLGQIETDLGAFQAEIDRHNTVLAAMQMGGAQGGAQLADKEYSASFNSHFRRGEVQASLNTGADADGGYLTPIEWDRTITNKLVLVSAMRQICRVQPTGKKGFSKLFNMRGTASGWVGEEDERPETNGPAFKTLAFGNGEIYANPAATQGMLDDGLIDVEAWLADEVQTEFARQEGSAFLSGDGTKKPFGLLTYIEGNANANAHPLGAIEVVSSGDANTITSDAVFDLIYALPEVFTGNARFALNRNTLGMVRKLKDNMGNYLWQPSLIAGEPSMLGGYAVTQLPDMPTAAAGTTPILFGDFQQTYTILDRVGVRVLRDPYTNKPYVSFYTTKRVGGAVVNPETMKAMKVGAA